MLSVEKKNIVLNEILRNLELPEIAYKKAKERYEDLGEELSKPKSKIHKYKPHVYSQGSFRLGTAIKPINEDDAYDLDLACELEEGITKKDSTQKHVKELVGEELEKYRISRGIKEQLEAKHRCWRLEYQDELNFHIDIVPCIPEEEEKRNLIKEAMLREGIDTLLSESVANLTVAITDDRHKKYDKISDDWKISNPQGYAKWFESRMKLAPPEFLQQRALFLEKANIDELPVFEWKTPLQQAIQLLKRHRDIMFKDNSDSKPISIIITTLAAKAYNGETEISETVLNILNRMGNFVNANKPKVPNPVDPSEDFADKWYDEKYQKYELEKNFYLWLNGAKVNFDLLFATDDPSIISERIEQKFKISLDKKILSNKLGIITPSLNIKPQKEHFETSQKPWLDI